MWLYNLKLPPGAGQNFRQCLIQNDNKCINIWCHAQAEGSCYSQIHVSDTLELGGVDAHHFLGILQCFQCFWCSMASFRVPLMSCCNSICVTCFETSGAWNCLNIDTLVPWHHTLNQMYDNQQVWIHGLSALLPCQPDCVVPAQEDLLVE